MDGNKVQAVLNGSEFSITLGNLTSNKTYIIKGYAINSAGVAYSTEVTFTTSVIVPVAGKIKDVDGNAYDTVRIGKQTWTVQNLQAKHYRDGSAIPVITDNTAWFNADKGAMCYYNNDAANGGVSYNQLAATDSRGIAPVGWHVPTIAEWEELWNYLGGMYVAGGYLKEAGLTHWLTPNYKADNKTGFTALPAGWRRETGVFSGLGESARWWSMDIGRCAYCTNIDGNLETTVVFDNRRGLSIRCVKDK
ncbi:MAG: fibrobacter succinogenes major paralogous domain-containing protein [Patescibacteria group bacterium]